MGTNYDHMDVHRSLRTPLDPMLAQIGTKWTSAGVDDMHGNHWTVYGHPCAKK